MTYFRNEQQPPMSKELRLLQLLQRRKSFTYDEQQRFDTLQKGFDGERKFFQLLQKSLVVDSFLFDLLLKSNGTVFQLDSIYLTNDSMTIIEVKNYAGDFYMEHDKWYIAKSKQEIRNPIEQLKRSEFLLKQLISKADPHLTVHSCLVFINDEFTLYNAPLDLPAIFPNQLRRVLKNIQLKQRKTTTTTESIATFLTSLHIKHSPFETIPTYTYEELRKGITCLKNCGGFLHPFAKNLFICNKCKEIEKKEKAIYHAIVQFHLLFPERHITTSTIHEWCNYIQSKNTLRNTLQQYFTQINNGKHTHYLFKSHKFPEKLQ